MSFKWRCIGSYFCEDDVGIYDTEFVNTAEYPYISVKNGVFESVKRVMLDNDEYMYYFHNGEIVNDSSGLLYCINEKKSTENNLPVKIEFKARIYKYIRKDITIEFLPNVYIICANINDMIIPCFSNGNDDDIIPFTADMINGEWFSMTVLWVDGVEYVYLGDVCIFNITADTILDNSDKFINTYNDNFSIGFDITDLKFYKMYEYSNPTFLYPEIHKENGFITLTVNSNVDDAEVDSQPEYIRLEFAKLKKGQKICTQNLEIEKCTLISETDVYKGMYGIKTFIDTVSNKQFDVHLFVNPCIYHNPTIVTDYQNLYNVSKYDSFNILFSVKQGNLDLSGRILSLYQSMFFSDCMDITFNVYMNQWLYSSVDRKFTDIEFLIPDMNYVNNIEPYVPDIEPVFIKHNIKFVVKLQSYTCSVNTGSLSIDSCTFLYDKDANEHEGYKVFHNNIVNKDFKVYFKDVSNLNPNIITNYFSYKQRDYNFIENEMYFEFVSEGLELCNISFSCGSSDWGIGYQYVEFYMDDTLIKTSSISMGSSTLNFTIPAQ